MKALGLYCRDHRWIYVGKDGGFAAEGKLVDDIVQLEKFASIDAPERSGVASSRPSSDHVPALMKAQSGPTAGVA